MRIGDTERATQDRVVSFFKDRDILDYEYLGNLKDAANKNIREDRLRAYLRLSGYSQKLIDGAVTELVKAADDMTHGLYDANHKVYSLLKYGAKVKETGDGAPKTVYFMDVETPTNNDFAIAEEVTVVGRQEKRPDLVIYVNGIAMAVIELKKSSVSVSNGIRQNLTNQKDGFIAPFFTTMQFCMAGNEIEGLRYGTIQTKEKYYMEWKPDGFHENEDERDPEDARIMAYCEKLDNLLLQQIYQMFDKKRFIDLIENFVVYDKGIKKVCRYNQFYGIKRTQRRLAKQRGGIIWHTQGSGKTLTMVWLSKWILANCEEENPRVLIVTDRDELDEQIEKTYIGVDEKITRKAKLKEKWASIPFDTMPFINSPIGHNPRMGALFDCIPIKDRKHELLARLVRNNTEIQGQLFTTVRDIVGFDDIPTLAEQYNDALWFGHREYSKFYMLKIKMLLQNLQHLKKIISHYTSA